MKRTRTTERTVRFKRELFDQIVEPHGHRSLRAKAKLLNCSVNTLWRMSTGASEPSAYFMSKVRAALPGVALEELFDFEVGRDRAA